MLIVPSGFKSAFESNIITSSNIIVKNSGNTTLYNGDNLISVNIVERNAYFFNGVPSISCTIKTINVQTMPSANTELRIYFEVNGYTSTNYLQVWVKETKLDTQKFYGTIKCVGHFEGYNSMLKTNDNRTNAYEVDYDTATARKVLDLLYYPSDTTDFFNLPTNPTIKYLYGFTEMTNVEVLQALAICVGGALYFDTNALEYSVRLFSNAQAVGLLPVLNVCSYDVDKDEKGTSVKMSYITTSDQPEELVVEGDVSGGQLNIRQNLPNNDYYITSVVFPNNNSANSIVQSPIFFNYFPNALATRSGDTSAGYVDFYGKQMRYTEVSGGQTGHIIKSPFLDSSNKNAVSTEATSYFSHDEIYTFEGRINPAFEPLDLIVIDGDIYSLEQVEINFNGSFNGKLVGRKVGTYTYKKPKLSNLNTDPNSYSFKIKNENLETMKLIIKYANNTGTYEFNIGAGATLTINSTNAPSLYDDFDHYDNNALAEDMYCYFVSLDGTITTSTTTILEASEPLAPTISNLNLGTGNRDWSFDINNPNAMALRVYIKSSQDEDIMMSIGSLQTLHITYSNAHTLDSSFTAYNDNMLEEDVLAYFTNTSGSTTSNNTIILEMNYVDSPYLSGLSYTSSSYGFLITNNNDFDCNLYFEYSGEGIAGYYLEAHQSRYFDYQDDNNEFTYLFTDYYYQRLTDAFICYFENADTGTPSDITIILEANG